MHLGAREASETDDCFAAHLSLHLLTQALQSATMSGWSGRPISVSAELFF